MARPITISNYYESPATGMAWGFNYDSIPASTNTDIIIDNITYNKLIGRGRELYLSIFGPASPFSDLTFLFTADQIERQSQKFLFYIFQPDGPGSSLSLYASNLNLTIPGVVNVDLPGSFKLVLETLSVGFNPISTYPKQEQINGQLRVEKFALESIDTIGQVQTWLTAGSSDEAAFSTALSLSQSGVNVNLSLQAVRLGTAILGYESDCNGSVNLAFASNTNILSISGSLTWSDLSTTVSTDINLDNGSIKRLSLIVQSGTRLQLAEEISIVAGQWEFTFAADDSASGTPKIFDLDVGKFQLQLGTLALTVGGEISGSFSSLSSINDFSLNRASLRLEDLLRIPLGSLELQLGKGSEIELQRDQQGNLTVHLHGSVSLAEQGQNSSFLSFQVSEDKPIQWNKDGFQFNGRIDLPSFTAGPFIIGDDAHISFSSEKIIADPDLKIDERLYSLLLRPVAEPLEQILLPITTPVLEFVSKQIPLPYKDSVSRILPKKEWWEIGAEYWNDAIDNLDQAKNHLLTGLTQLLESSPNRSDRWLNGKLEVVDLLDFILDSAWRLVQQAAKTGSLNSLEAIGLDRDVIQAFVKMPVPQIAASLEILATFQEVIKMIQASPVIGEANLVDLSELNFELNINENNAYANNASNTRNYLAKIFENSNSLVNKLNQIGQDFSKLGAPSDDGMKVGGYVKPFIELPIFSDLMGTFNALLNDKSFALIELGINAKLALAFAYNQIFDLLPYVGFPLPMTFGFDSRLNIQVNPSLGLSTRRSVLQTTALGIAEELSNIATVDDIDSAILPILAQINKLLFPIDSFEDPNYRADPYGLYLSHPDGLPLLGVNSELRLNAGIDYYNLFGLRLYTGIGADFDISINSPSASENSPNNSRLFLVDAYDAIKPLLDAASNVEDISTNSATELLAGSLASLKRLIELFDYRFQAYIPWGVEPKLPILGWLKDLQYITGKITLPAIVASSGTIAFAGPVQESLVHYDARKYNEGLFVGNGNLRIDPGSFEPFTQTDSTGNFRLHLNPSVCDSNRDGVIDFKDGLVIVSSYVDEDSFHLLDSITGLDLGFPLVALPGGNASILTTLKYMMLIRWTPSSAVHTPEGPKPLTPELINQLLPLFLDVPQAVLDDGFNPYAALQGNLEQQQAGSESLRFFYEQAFLIYAIADLFTELKLDYSSPSLWGREGVELDPKVSDSIPVVSTNAWGYALTQLFGYAGVTRTTAAALGPNQRFDLTNTAHLAQFFKTILASYPTLDLWKRYTNEPTSNLQQFQQSFINSVRDSEEILAADNGEREARIKAFRQDAAVVDNAIDQLYGESLAQLSYGLADLIQTFREQFGTVTDLTGALSTGGVELLIPAIAGIKREAISTIIPQIVKFALDKTTDTAEFKDWIHSELQKPIPIDNNGRQYNYAIRFANEPPRVQGHRLALKVQLVHRDQNGPQSPGLVAAPDYGLTLRYRLGGTARPGLDYAVAAQGPLVDPGSNIAAMPLLSFAPGASEAELWIDLNPNSLDGMNPLSLQVQLLNADSGFAVEADRALLDLTLSSQASRFAITSASAYVAPACTASELQTVALGQDGLAEPSYQFGLLPSLNAPVLPHIAAFDPLRDQIVVDSASLIEIRRRKLGLIGDSDQQGTAGAASLQLRDQDLAIVAGILVDRVSDTPLATVSAPDQGGIAVAWSQVHDGDWLRFGSINGQSITLGGMVFAPGQRLALKLSAMTTALPWLEASSLVLAGAAGQPSSPLMHMAGAAHGYATGYSPQQVVTVTLPSLPPGGPQRLLIQPYSKAEAGIPLSLHPHQDNPKVVELLLPGGQVWGQLISAEAELLSPLTPPPLLFEAVSAAPANGGPAEAALLIVPAGSQLGGADPFGSTPGLSLERSLDGGLSWSSTTARQARLAAGVVQFRARQRLADGSQLLGPVLNLAVDAQGVAVRSETPAATIPWTANAAVPSFELALHPIGENRIPMWTVPLEGLGVDRVAQSRQLTVDLRLLREARLESSLTLALVREGDAQVIDPLTGAALGSLSGLNQSGAHGALDGLTWSTPRNGDSTDVRLKLSLAPGLDLNNHCLIPLLRVPGVVTRIYSSAAAFNPDGQQHVLPMGATRFGFEDQFGGGDWDGDDAVVQVLAMGLSLPA